MAQPEQRVLLERDRVVEDPWHSVGDGEAIPGDRPVILPLDRWRAERDALARSNQRLGVRLPAGTLAADLERDLDRLSLVAVEFPKFRDGRGFSAARELRERFGFKGEVRAVGHVLPDQHQALLRTGFSSVELPRAADLPAWTAALRAIDVVYQPGTAAPGEDEEEAPLSHLRRRFAPR